MTDGDGTIWQPGHGIAGPLWEWAPDKLTQYRCGCGECHFRFYHDAVILWEGNTWRLSCAFREALSRSRTVDPPANLTHSPPEDVEASCDSQQLQSGS